MQEFVKDNEKIFYGLLVNSIVELKSLQRVDTDMNALEKLAERAREFSKNPVDNYEFLAKPIDGKTIKGYENYDRLVELAFKILEEKMPKINIVDSDDNKLVSIYLNIVL